MEHYLVAMAVTAGIYALMALGMNVIWGMAGLINLGLVGFFAVGAYVSGLLTLKLGLPIVVGMAAGAAAASAFGVAVALVTVRLRGDYLAIVTLGFAETMRIVMSNELWIANGTDGLSGIPGPVARHARPAPVQSVLSRHRRRGGDRAVLPGRPPGARAVRPRAARHPRRRADRRRWPARTSCCSRSRPSASAPRRSGFAGALYGHFTSYIAPDLFAPLLTLYIKLSLLAGGLGNSSGAVLGAVARRLLPRVDALHRAADPGISAVQGAALRELMISVALLVILRFYAKGLIPERIEHPALPLAAAAPAPART